MKEQCLMYTLHLAKQMNLLVFLSSSAVSMRLCGLFWSPWPFLILLPPLWAIAHLPLSVLFILSPLRPPTYILTVPPWDFSLSLLCLIASLFAPGDGLGSAILSTVPSQIHLHPLPARSLSWAALEEISDDLTFQQKQGNLGSAIGCEALLFSPLISICPSCQEFLLSSTGQGQNHTQHGVLVTVTMQYPHRYVKYSIPYSFWIFIYLFLLGSVLKCKYVLKSPRYPTLIPRDLGLIGIFLTIGGMKVGFVAVLFFYVLETEVKCRVSWKNEVDICYPWNYTLWMMNPFDHF